MATRSLQEQIQALIQRSVVEPRSRGFENTDTEARALLESIASNLLVRPKSVLLLTLLAKNGLQKAITDEIAIIESLASDIQDLSNPTYKVRYSSDLKKAKNALLQLEQLDNISSGSTSFSKFNEAVSNFLTDIHPTTVSDGVLLRTADEAKADLVTDYGFLEALHSDFLDRLYALAVCVENYLTSPLNSVVGLLAASRAKEDIQSIIDTIDAAGAVSANRDLIMRMIGNRASVSVMTSAPIVDEILVDTQTSKPIGYTPKAKSDPATASVSFTSSSPYVTLPIGSNIAMVVNGVSFAPSSFPHQPRSLNNLASLSGTAISFPLDIHPGAELYLQAITSGTTFNYRVPVTSNSYANMNDLLAQLNTDLGSVSAPFVCDEYIAEGSSRILIISLNAGTTSFQFVTNVVEFPTPGAPVIYGPNSLATLLGFTEYTKAVPGTPLQYIVDFFNLSSFNVAVKSTLQALSVQIETLSSDPGVSLALSGAGPIGLGINGVFTGSSNSIRLYGTVNGVQTDPISVRDLVGVGDLVTLSTGQATVVSIDSSRIVLDTALQTVDGNVTIDSVLVIKYEALKAALDSFLEDWLGSDFTENLKWLDAALAGISESPTAARQNQALAALNSLKSLLNQLLSSISTISLPAGAAPLEQEVIQGIIATLEERKFDRALDLFLRAKVQEVLDLGTEETSYGSNFLKAASTLAQSDVAFPNPANDEGLEADSSQDKSV